MIKANALKKLDQQTLSKILDAQISELVERRAVQDEKLFRYAFFTANRSANDSSLVVDFSDAAQTAFDLYHDLRRQGAHLSDEGDLVLDHPNADTADMTSTADTTDTTDTADTTTDC